METASSAPIFKETRYEASLVSCDKELLLSIDNNVYSVSLFNLTYLKGQNISISCPYLFNAQSISIELDLNSNMKKGLDAYVFIDNDLLQAKLIEDNLAKMTISNPEYKYYEDMIQETQNVSGEMNEAFKSRSFDRTHGNQIIIFLFIIQCLLVLVAFSRKIYKKIKICD